MSRTAGVPLGPHAGDVEPIGLVDTLSKVAEVLLIAILLTRARANETPVATLRRRPRTTVVATALAAALIGGAAIGAPVPGHESHARAADAHELAPSVEPGHEDAAGAHGDEEVSEEHGEHEWPPGPPEVVAVPAGPRRAPESTLVAAVRSGGIWLYDAAADEATPLTDAQEPWEGSPTFIDADRLEYVDPDGLHEIDLRTGDVRAIARGSIADYAWNDNLSALALLNFGGLYVYRTSDGALEKIMEIPQGGGRCGGEGDQSLVAWSPDGSALLVVFTALDWNGETMFVLRPDGTSIVPARAATQALWSPDGRTISYVDWDSGRRYVLDVVSGEARPVGAREWSIAPVFSPDGGKLAYHVSIEGREMHVPRLYELDLVAGVERRISDDRAWAVWLTNDELAATRVQNCDECWEGWDGTGETRSSGDGGERSLALPSTMDADVIHAAPQPATDERPAPEPSSSPDDTSSGESASPILALLDDVALAPPRLPAVPLPGRL